jgi:hypothetical protein
LGNKEQQIAFQLVERQLLTGGQFVLRELVQPHHLHRLVGLRDLEAQQFIEAPLAFGERE